MAANAFHLEHKTSSLSLISCCCVLAEETVESDDEDNLSQAMRHRTTIPWRSCGKYLSSAGLLLLPLLLLSQLLKHTFMVSIDVWLAHWTSDVIHAKINAVRHNCTLVQVQNNLSLAYFIHVLIFSKAFPYHCVPFHWKTIINMYLPLVGWFWLCRFILGAIFFTYP